MGDDDIELLVRERRSLDILSVKKEARLSVRLSPAFFSNAVWTKTRFFKN